MATGDYSTHEPNDKTKEKDWSLLPTQRQADLYVVYLTVFLELGNLIDDEPHFAETAERTGSTVAEVEAAVYTFLDWAFNDES